MRFTLQRESAKWDMKNQQFLCTLTVTTCCLRYRVTALERNLVSWSRVDSSSGLPELLTVGFRPHSGENRFILDLAQPNDHRLRISNVQWRDAGIYLCQLSVHPPAILVSRLQLVKPVVNIIDFTTSVSAPRELYYDSGTTIELACRVRLAPMGGASIMWQVAHAEGTRILNMDVTRGGVRVVTGREPDAGWIVSRLSLAWARAGDAGNYTCTLTGVPPALKYTAGLSDTVYVHVLQGDNTEAIYSKGSARSSSMLLLLLFSLTTRRICT